MNDQQGLAITSAGTVINHLHGGPTVARRGTAADHEQRPGIHLGNVKARLWSSAETGSAVVPWREGKPRALVAAATVPMRVWVIDQIDTGQPSWMRAPAADGAELPQSQPLDVTPGETP
jgi:hypothetical protein